MYLSNYQSISIYPALYLSIHQIYPYFYQLKLLYTYIYIYEKFYMQRYEHEYDIHTNQRLYTLFPLHNFYVTSYWK